MKNAVILEKLDRGTILTSLQSGAYQSQLKLLKSSVENWISICKILEDDEKDEIIVLAKFTEFVLFLFCLPKYESVAIRLLLAVKRKKHIIYIYHNNFVGEFSCNTKKTWRNDVLDIDDIEDYLKNPFSAITESSLLNNWMRRYGIDENPALYEEKVRSFVQDLNESEYNIVPYRKLIDIEISGQSFIESIDQGLIFRVYVPNDRLWAKEIDRFVILFRDYASSTSKSEIKVIQNRTGKGVTFSLYCNDGSLSVGNVGKLFDEFSSFLDLCSSDLNGATKLLATSKIENNEIGRIITRYAKEAQRLMLDLNHEREAKILNIKHRFESEIFESKINEDIKQYIDEAVPLASTSGRVIFGSKQEVNASVINITNNYIQKMDGIIASEISGNINTTPEEAQLRLLIDNYVNSTSAKSELKSAIDELKDESLSQNERIISWQKLQAFLGKVGSKAGDVAIQLLQKYIEQKLGL